MKIDRKLKYIRIKRISERIIELKSERSSLKKGLNLTLTCHLSVNSMIEEAKKYQRSLSRKLNRIHELRHQYNYYWNDLSYEEKVRYRYWIHGEDVPSEDSVLTSPNNAPISEEPKRSSRHYFKIDRENAQKLCSKLIEFLSGKDEYFKVGFDESNAS